jgi:hypothetical protein
MNGELVLQSWQLLLIGGVAALVVQILKLLAAQFGWDIHRGWTTVIAFVISVIMAYFFFPVEVIFVPDDPMTSAQNLIAAASALLGSATLVYNVLLEKIATKFSLTKERFLGSG